MCSGANSSEPSCSIMACWPVAPRVSDCLRAWMDDFTLGLCCVYSIVVTLARKAWCHSSSPVNATLPHATCGRLSNDHLGSFNCRFSGNLHAEWGCHSSLMDDPALPPARDKTDTTPGLAGIKRPSKCQYASAWMDTSRRSILCVAAAALFMAPLGEPAGSS